MAETATTAAVTIFPTTNDVVGGSGLTTAGLGKTLGEAALARLLAMPFHDKPYVKSGGAYTLVSGRTYRHTTAYAMIAGYSVVTKATPETLTCEASQTCYTWLQLVRNASSQVTGARWVVTSTASAPTLPTYGITGDQVMFGYVTANASAITAQGDTPRGIIAPGIQIPTAYKENAGDSAGTGDKLGPMTIVGDGVTAIEVRVQGFADNSTGGAVNDHYLRDASGGGGNALDHSTNYGGAAGAIPDGDFNLCGVADPFFGPKSFYLWATTTAGSYVLRGTRREARMWATWAPGRLTS